MRALGELHRPGVVVQRMGAIRWLGCAVLLCACSDRGVVASPPLRAPVVARAAASPTSAASPTVVPAASSPATVRERRRDADRMLLIDARHGLKDVDDDVLKTLDKAAVSYQVVLTKGDALKKSEQEAMVAATAEKIRRRPAAFPQVLLTSSEKGLGIPELRAAIARTLAERA